MEETQTQIYQDLTYLILYHHKSIK